MLEYAATLHIQNRLPVSGCGLNGVGVSTSQLLPLLCQVWCWSHPQTGVNLTRASMPIVDEQDEAPDPGLVGGGKGGTWC